MLQLGIVLNHRYSIVEKIGSGGMSIVYKARDTKLNRFVAIKVLREEFCLNEEFVKKFKVEAQSAASLSHNNIVNIYDVGQEGRTHFIVMEYLEGETLKDYIQRHGMLSDQEILKISMCIAQALDHAHLNHIIHRDIKPQNILMTYDGKVKVADFGIARVASDKTIDMPENPAGSVYYIAPEQARGGYQDIKSDIYSLGITMYEMATGSLPFTGDNAVNVALKHIHDEMPNPTEINTQLSKNIETIILKATQKKTTLRYQTAKEIIEDLKTSMTNPEDILVYTREILPDETIVMTGDEMKHIWNKSEVREYGGKKDPLDRIVTISGIILAFALVLIISLLVYNNYAKKMIPVNVVVPNVKGLSINEAEALVIASQLKMNVLSNEYNDTVPEGKIIRQTPEEQTQVLKDEIVEVVVSKGAETIKVINVMNLEYSEAKDKIEALGLSVEIIPEYNDVVKAGDVMRQDPLPNEAVPINSVIKLYVSKGVEEKLIEVPDLVNVLLPEAQSVIQSLKLGTGNVTYLYSDTIEKDRVISMSVEAQKEVKEGYVIDLVVSLGKEIKAVSKSFAINSVLNNDQTECVLKVVYDQNGEVKTLFQDTVNASSFPMILEVTELGEGTIRVFNDDVQQYEFFVQFTVEESE